MELYEALKSRRSIRKFKDDPVPSDLIMKILEAGRLAPSGSNIQPSRFIVIKSPEAKQKLKECTALSFVQNAPAVIVCIADSLSMDGRELRISELREAGAFTGTQLETPEANEMLKTRLTMTKEDVLAYLKFNVAISVDHMTLRATDLGLGSCWIGLFDREKTKRALGLFDNHHVVALLPIGYPDQEPAPRPRIPMEQILLGEF